jgi:hypothetical protein
MLHGKAAMRHPDSAINALPGILAGRFGASPYEKKQFKEKSCH